VAGAPVDTEPLLDVFSEPSSPDGDTDRITVY
jgi:hypothetical protein